MISGALVTTANSSGGSLVAPIAVRTLSQAVSETAMTHTAASGTNFRTPLLLCIAGSRAFSLWRGTVFRPQQGVVQERGNPEGDRAICDVEHIPIVAPEIKVKKVGDPAIDQAVNEISD